MRDRRWAWLGALDPAERFLMPQDKDFKRIVRRRMAATGEPYTAARAALDPPQRTPPRTDAPRWVEELARPGPAEGLAAVAALKALPADLLRPAALAGLDHPSWRVRRSCCRLLDDLSLTPETIAALERCLSDGQPSVRQAAMHTLGCRHCKPDGCALDVGALYQRMASDSNRRVRLGIFHALTWAYTDEPWTPELLRRFAEEDPSEQLRQKAAAFILTLESRNRANELRLQLPPDLRDKTERHRGKWVAIAGGRIVAVACPRAIRHARRTYPDTAVYWVAAAAS